MCILYGCIIKLNKTACHMVAISRCKLKTGPDIRANLILALDPRPGKGLGIPQLAGGLKGSRALFHW